MAATSRASRVRDLGGAPGGWRSAEMLREQRDRDIRVLRTGGTTRKTKPGSGHGQPHRGGASGAGRRAAPARALPVLDAEADRPARQGWQQAITSTVQGLGYDLVDVERAGRGLLRITIDRIPGRTYGLPGAPDTGEFITVEDCEAVTRQLQYVLEVEGLEYARLEVSSPGLDRPLRNDADYHRFAGLAVKITLREPFEGRRHWEGVLGLGDAEGAYTLLCKKGGKVDAAEQQLGFVLAEVREARLVPVLDFKGRKPRAAAALADEPSTDSTNESATGPAPDRAPETTKG
jgi:ribosome maturation factor RimP